MSLTGKKALVLGGSKGLGYACAEALANQGCALHLMARDPQALESAANQLTKQYGISVGVSAVDITQAADFTRALGHAGECDILLGNCGGPPLGNFDDFDLSDWEGAYQGQIRSAVQACKSMLPGMKERGWGRIILIASITVEKALPGLILSSALRPGLAGLARSLSQEYAASGVTTNLICPGLTLTDRLNSLIEKGGQDQNRPREAIIQAMTQAIPAGRLGRPEEIGATAAFLASDGAAFITGQSLMVDGGQTA